MPGSCVRGGVRRRSDFFEDVGVEVCRSSAFTTVDLARHRVLVDRTRWRTDKAHGGAGPPSSAARTAVIRRTVASKTSSGSTTGLMA